MFPQILELLEDLTIAGLDWTLSLVQLTVKSDVDLLTKAVPGVDT